MRSFDMNRRALCAGAITAGAIVAAAPALAQAAPLRLIHRPERIFKAGDLAREGTEAWFVTLGVESDVETEVSVANVALRFLSNGVEIATETHQRAGLIVRTNFPAPTHEPDGTPRAPKFWPTVIRLVCRQPAAANIDSMHVVVAFADGRPPLETNIPIGVYTHQTALVFPFRGNGVITQAGAANGGHRNTSGQFALDALGATETYAVQTGAAFAINTDLVGFGRELIAPAAGLIVRARGDRPDQPVPGVSNEDFHIPEMRGGGDPGNHVIIDHGNGEFSMMAHFMAGSLRVSNGARVTQGEIIAQLGNSGDSSAPHVHYQLQGGPMWEVATALPCRFTNVTENLDRGAFFTAT